MRGPVQYVALNMSVQPDALDQPRPRLPADLKLSAPQSLKPIPAEIASSRSIPVENETYNTYFNRVAHPNRMTSDRIFAHYWIETAFPLRRPQRPWRASSPPALSSVCLERQIELRERYAARVESIHELANCRRTLAARQRHAAQLGRRSPHGRGHAFVAA